jgi:electron transport complex protein RnfB
MPSAATDPTLVELIDACLPQTQCTRCGYPRCRDYAKALATGRADINRCPPGGDVTLQTLSRLLGVAVKPLDPECGTHEPRTRAIIDEARCIGCRKCLDVCPVDAIVGARKLMHTVIAAECDGCELCLPPCPVNCILMLPVTATADGPWPDYSMEETARWRARAQQRLARLAHPAVHRNIRRACKTENLGAIEHNRDRIRAEIRAAVERVRTRRARSKTR